MIQQQSFLPGDGVVCAARQQPAEDEAIMSANLFALSLLCYL